MKDRQRARLAAAGLFIGWLAGIWFAVPVIAAFLLKTWLFASRLPFRYPWTLLFADWRLPALAAIMVLIAATGAERRTLYQRAGLRWAGLWPAACLCFFLWRFCAAVAANATQPNRYGFYPSFRDGETHRVQGDKSSVPEILVRVNSQGFRDDEWTAAPAPGVRRIALVGDSMVFGYGIPDEKDLLHRQLERELNRARAGRWEVLNLASLPSGIWYYVQALVRVGLPARPDVMVMSYLAVADLPAYDDQCIKADVPPLLASALLVSGVLRQFSDLTTTLGPRFGRRGGVPPAEVRHAREELAALVREIERKGVPLVVWMPFGPRDPLFDPYQDHPLISFLTPAELPEFRGRDDLAWHQDPMLAIPGDGHPTAAGNAIFARGIARKILKVAGR